MVSVHNVTIEEQETIYGNYTIMDKMCEMLEENDILRNHLETLSIELNGLKTDKGTNGKEGFKGNTNNIHGEPVHTLYHAISIVDATFCVNNYCFKKEKCGLLPIKANGLEEEIQESMADSFFYNGDNQGY